MLIHPISPIYDCNSKILILGSFPSVKSRDEGFFYGHPQNRFWKVLSLIYNQTLPCTVEEKKRFLLNNGIALWDVIKSCDLQGSADSSITNVLLNDISLILNNCNINKIFTNGKTSQKYYDLYLKDKLTVDSICLPSTSPANAGYNLEKLVQKWAVIKD